MSRRKPCVCVMEDDWQRMKNVVMQHEERKMERLFDVRFVVSEQHYWDQLGNSEIGESSFQRVLGERTLFDRAKDPFPSFFVIDMMLTWDSNFYDCSIPRDREWKIDRAGLRIADSLRTSKMPEHTKRFHWIIWTSVPCEELRVDEMRDKILYKDNFEIYDMLNRAANTIRTRR